MAVPEGGEYANVEVRSGLEVKYVFLWRLRFLDCAPTDLVHE